MDFALSKEQEAIKDAADRFAQGVLRHVAGEGDGWFRSAWRKCAEFGVLGAPMPERFGGSGRGLLDTVLLMEGLGRGGADRGLLFSINAQLWSVQRPLLAFGTEEQKERYLPALCGGDLIGAHCMTEPQAGSDACSLRARARQVHGGYVLDGSKTLITNAPIADVFVVFANVEPSRGRWGITAFLVDRGTPGLLTGPDFEKLGLQSAPLGEVALQDCFVAEDGRLGPEGAGVAVFNSSMEWERASILAAQLGAMQRQFEETVAYARSRKQFKTEIGKLPPVRERVAEMRVRLELARLILYEVGWLKDRGTSAELEAAIAKLYLSEAAVQSSLDAMRVFGGYGYLTATGREAELRDSIGGLFYSGTSDLQRVLIAGLLGL